MNYMDDKEEGFWATFSYSISFAAQLGYLIILPLLAGVFFGIKIDNLLGIKPFGLIFSLIVSILFSFALVYKHLSIIIKK